MLSTSKTVRTKITRMWFQIYVPERCACLGEQIMPVYEEAVSVPRHIFDAQKCQDIMDRIK